MWVTLKTVLNLFDSNMLGWCSYSSKLMALPNLPYNMALSELICSLTAVNSLSNRSLSPLSRSPSVAHVWVLKQWLQWCYLEQGALWLRRWMTSGKSIRPARSAHPHRQRA